MIPSTVAWFRRTHAAKNGMSKSFAPQNLAAFLNDVQAVDGQVL
jgi:hypothetical protein